MDAPPTSAHCLPSNRVSYARHDKTPKLHVPQLPYSPPPKDVCHGLVMSLEVSVGKFATPALVTNGKFPSTEASLRPGVSVWRKPKLIDGIDE